jgi:pilus assembly protein Flp/PilA
VKNIINRISAFVREDEGLTTVEYAVAGVLVSIAVVGAFTALGTQVGLSIGLLTTAVTP